MGTPRVRARRVSPSGGTRSHLRWECGGHAPVVLRPWRAGQIARASGPRYAFTPIARRSLNPGGRWAQTELLQVFAPVLGQAQTPPRPEGAVMPSTQRPD